LEGIPIKQNLLGFGQTGRLLDHPRLDLPHALFYHPVRVLRVDQ